MIPTTFTPESFEDERHGHLALFTRKFFKRAPHHRAAPFGIVAEVFRLKTDLRIFTHDVDFGSEKREAVDGISVIDIGDRHQVWPFFILDTCQVPVAFLFQELVGFVIGESADHRGKNRLGWGVCQGGGGLEGLQPCRRRSRLPLWVQGIAPQMDSLHRLLYANFPDTRFTKGTDCLSTRCITQRVDRLFLRFCKIGKRDDGITTQICQSLVQGFQES